MKSAKIQQRLNCQTNKPAMQGISLLDFQKIIDRTLKMQYKPYIRNINRIFVEEFKEAAPLDENAKIEILFGQAAQTFREEAYQQQINGESTEIEIDLIDWCSDMLYKEGYEDIELMTEALYHINCDYLLSDYLQWPMYDTKRENPFRPYFELWKMGLNIYFPERGRVVLIG